MYIHDLNEWPKFAWNQQDLDLLLEKIQRSQDSLNSEINRLGFKDQSEASLRILTADVVKTSEIEGEILDPLEVRSSIARRLGLDAGGTPKADRNVDGIVEVMIDATKKYAEPITKQRLCGWHALLFPTGYSSAQKIVVGDWRPGKMEVLSGVIGKERVHFTAPDQLRVPGEMDRFLQWFETEADLNLVIKAAIAHLHFVTIHPFDDGNGRIARAIADLALARADGKGQRFYSMSTQIRTERKDYYAVLENTQKGTLDITEWLTWFLNCLNRSIEQAQIVLDHVLRKARIWDCLKDAQINDRQTYMLNRILDDEFFGALNAKKWSVMNNCSLDTANRDLTRLTELGVLEKGPGKGKKTSYSLKDPTGAH